MIVFNQTPYGYSVEDFGGTLGDIFKSGDEFKFETNYDYIILSSEDLKAIANKLDGLNGKA